MRPLTLLSTAVIGMAIGVPASALAGESVEDAVPELRAFLPEDADREPVLRHLEREVRSAFPKDAKLRSRVLENIAQNLADKQALLALNGKSFALTADEIRRTVIGYEIFKL